MKARGWASRRSRYSRSSPPRTLHPSCPPSAGLQPPWQPAVEGSRGLGGGQPDAPPRNPRPNWTSVPGLNGWLWCSRLMRMGIKGPAFIAAVLRNQVGLSRVSGSQDAIAGSFDFLKSTSLMGDRSLERGSEAQTVCLQELCRYLGEEEGALGF